MSQSSMCQLQGNFPGGLSLFFKLLLSALSIYSTKLAESTIKMIHTIAEKSDTRITTLKHNSSISKSTTALHNPEQSEQTRIARTIYPPALQRRNSSLTDIRSSKTVTNSNAPKSLSLNTTVDEVQKKKSKFKALFDKFTKKDKKKNVADAAGMLAPI